MVNKIHTASISLWSHEVGAVAWREDRQIAVFEYDPTFIKTGLDIAPITMPLAAARNGQTIFSFADTSRQTWLGLPGLLADSLPDKYGNSIIDTWLARKGRDAASFSPVERLCYTGKRGMGALEFAPAVNPGLEKAVAVEVSELAELAQNIMLERSKLQTNLDYSDDQQNTQAILDILRVGTSAGGARPKAIIAMNQAGDVISGQTQAPEGYDYWLLKFDGVTDLELGKPNEFGRIEYAYSLMARAAGIQMSDCRLLEENGRAHFLTRRFDRQQHDKLHMQSLCGLAHYDFNMAGAYSYEQLFALMRKLRLSKADAIQQYRRMVFNVLARNQDDHTKNFAFIMNQQGKWTISPAFDLTYAHNPAGKWTSKHQLTINGKRDLFTLDDLLTIGHHINLPKPMDTIEEVANAVADWTAYSKQAGMTDKLIKEISAHHRLDILS